MSAIDFHSPGEPECKQLASPGTGAWFGAAEPGHGVDSAVPENETGYPRMQIAI
jgi:hypothetical protein